MSTHCGSDERASSDPKARTWFSCNRAINIPAHALDELTFRIATETSPVLNFLFHHTAFSGPIGGDKQSHQCHGKAIGRRGPSGIGSFNYILYLVRIQGRWANLHTGRGSGRPWWSTLYLCLQYPLTFLLISVGVLADWSGSTSRQTHIQPLILLHASARRPDKTVQILAPLPSTCVLISIFQNTSAWAGSVGP